MARILPFDREADRPAGEPVPGDEAGQAATGDSLEWAHWMRLAQAGDRATYQRLLQAIVPYIAAIAHRHLEAADLVDDAVQDVLLIVHRVRHTFEPERPFKPWLATIARRHCIDLARRRQRRMRREIADDVLLEMHAGDGSPEQAMQRRQDAAGLRRAVSGLPHRQREAVGLLKLEELSLREASDRSGQSVPALKVGVHRALKSLRRRLDDEANDAPGEDRGYPQ